MCLRMASILDHGNYINNNSARVAFLFGAPTVQRIICFDRGQWCLRDYPLLKQCGQRFANDFKVRYSGCLTSIVKNACLNFQQDFPKSRIISLAIGIPKILENIFIRNFRSI